MKFLEYLEKKEKDLMFELNLTRKYINELSQKGYIQKAEELVDNSKTIKQHEIPTLLYNILDRIGMLNLDLIKTKNLSFFRNIDGLGPVSLKNLKSFLSKKNIVLR